VTSERDNMVGLDAAILMPPQVWIASGHVENFSAPLLSAKSTIPASAKTIFWKLLSLIPNHPRQPKPSKRWFVQIAVVN
jgi:hypothetical protein